MGLVSNPGDLRSARISCGSSKCHSGIPERVEKSIMATNRGILEVLQARWPHNRTETVSTVRELISRPQGQSLALDHYRKMCGGCHLWKTRSPWKGEIGRRGGGCTNCHVEELTGPRQDLEKKGFRHPGLTTRIPNSNCLKCHNRSARMALSYQGRFESEGYGTPYEGADLNSRRLTGGRFYLELPPDVHFQMAGLDCIDCHTERGLMGAGNAYSRMREQVDITCNTCHDPEVKAFSAQKTLADRLHRINKKQPFSENKRGVLSRKGSPMYQLRVSGERQITLYRKRDGKKIPFQRLGNPEIHRASYHRRLSCQACHSAWIPQCYGCHVALLKGDEQKDWLSQEKSRGRWVEGRSYLRFRRPTLGIGPGGQISPFAPGCQVFLDVFDEQGRHQPEQAHVSLTMASFDPHTTGKGAPECLACHINPKVLGMGEGSLEVTSRGLAFKPIYDSQASGLGIPFSLDAFVSPDGRPLQKASGIGARPFNAEELKRITRAAQCLVCHDTYDDPIFREYKESLHRFEAGETPCREELP
ncbi:MAG: hypothetical protein JRG79_05025 [Deltaproteobacteria bacterium]|nr:hypothetical protein [Deltaproteobacteria bacterium]